MITTIVISVVSTIIIGALSAFFAWVAKRAMKDLKNHLTPNGGESLYDKVVQAKATSQKALDMAILVDAGLKEVKIKLDAIILSRLP